MRLASPRKLLEDFSLSERQALFILGLIMVLSFLLRIYALSAESLNHDEVRTIYIAKNNFTTIIERLSAETHVHPPFYYIILHFWMKLFGDSEFSIRFVSVIFGVASVYVMYRLGKLIFSEDVGVISAFILSISLFHIRYSQEAKMYALLTLLVLISNYYFVKILKERNKKNTALYIISTAAMLYTHVFGLFYIIFQNIYYIFVHKKNIKFWIAVQGAILLIFAPWIPVLIKQVTKVEAGIWIPRPTSLTLFNTFKSFAGSEISLYLFIILAAAGMIWAGKHLHELNYRIFLLLWLFIPILAGFTISLISQPIYVSKYVIASLPALILLVSKGIFNFRFRKNLIISFLLIILILPTISPLERYYRVPEKEQWKEVTSYIENNKGDNDFVIIYDTPGRVPFSYYYNDSNFRGISKASQVKNLTKGHNGIWLIMRRFEWHARYAELANESKLTEKTLSQTHVKQYSRNFTGLKLSYYVPKNQNIGQ